MRETYVKVIFKVWCIESEWFVDEGKNLGLTIASCKKTRENIILGNNIVAAYGPKDKIDALCDLIKKEDYDIEIIFYEKYEIGI